METAGRAAHFLSYNHHHHEGPQTLRNTLLSTTAHSRATHPVTYYSCCEGISLQLIQFGHFNYIHKAPQSEGDEIFGGFVQE